MDHPLSKRMCFSLFNKKKTIMNIYKTRSPFMLSEKKLEKGKV